MGRALEHWWPVRGAKFVQYIKKGNQWENQTNVMDLISFDPLDTTLPPSSLNELSDIPPPPLNDDESDDDEVTFKLPPPNSPRVSAENAAHTRGPIPRVKEQQRITRPIIQIETFHGNSKENIHEFRENFYRASVINGWGADAQALLIPSYLAGRARELYHSFDQHVKDSASQIFQELIAHFSSAAVRYQTKQMVAERLQGKNESVSDYFQNISALVRKAWGGQNKRGEREKLIESFVNGLRPNIKKVFWNQEPECIEKALIMAESREIYLKSKRKNLEVNAVSNSRDQQIKLSGSTLGDKEDELRELRGALKDLKAKLADQEAEVKQKDEIIKGMRSGRVMSTTNYAPPSGEQVSKATPSCWSCGSLSHFRRDCPNIKNNYNPPQ